MKLKNGPERKYHLIIVRCLATGDVFDFINNSQRTDPKKTPPLSSNTHTHSLTFAFIYEYIDYFTIIDNSPGTDPKENA
jgi:hypothetical protein